MNREQYRHIRSNNYNLVELFGIDKIQKFEHLLGEKTRKSPQGAYFFK